MRSSRIFYKMNGNIYWLASYPKSGNTWMRVLLTNYLRDADEPADINELNNGPIASSRLAFDENLGIEASDMTQDEIEQYRPLVYEYMSTRIEESMFCKVHDAYTYTPQGIPLISKKATAGVIYLIRNPLDICGSLAHHSATTVDTTIEHMADQNHTLVDNPYVLFNQLRQRLLTWSNHVKSWVDEPGLRILVVRYEDLLADTNKVFTEVLNFSGQNVETDRVKKAVEFSKFENLKSQEIEHGFGEKMPLSESFFRKGVAGSWRENLSPAQASSIVECHGEVMRRFSYNIDLDKG